MPNRYFALQLRTEHRTSSAVPFLASLPQALPFQRPVIVRVRLRRHQAPPMRSVVGCGVRLLTGVYLFGIGQLGAPRCHDDCDLGHSEQMCQGGQRARQPMCCNGQLGPFLDERYPYG